MAEENRRPRPEVKHETSDVDIQPVLLLLVGTGLLLLVSMGAMGLLFSFLESRYRQAQQTVSPLADEMQIPPSPRLQSNPAVELEAYEAQQEKALHRPAWEDRASGKVRIPIDRAMQLAIEKGIFRSRGDGEEQ